MTRERIKLDYTAPPDALDVPSLELPGFGQGFRPGVRTVSTLLAAAVFTASCAPGAAPIPPAAGEAAIDMSKVAGSESWFQAMKQVALDAGRTDMAYQIDLAASSSRHIENDIPPNLPGADAETYAEFLRQAAINTAQWAVNTAKGVKEAAPAVGAAAGAEAAAKAAAGSKPGVLLILPYFMACRFDPLYLTQNQKVLVCPDGAKYVLDGLTLKPFKNNQ